MTCMKCNNDLAECWCPDMPDRLEGIKGSEFIYIGLDYLARLEAQAELVHRSGGQQEVKE